MSLDITWTRPSGSEITTNDLPETIAEAKINGWVKKRKRRTNAEIKNDNSGDTGKTDTKRD